MTVRTTGLTPRIGMWIETDLDTLLSGRHATELRELGEAHISIVDACCDDTYFAEHMVAGEA